MEGWMSEWVGGRVMRMGEWARMGGRMGGEGNGGGIVMAGSGEDVKTEEKREEKEARNTKNKELRRCRMGKKGPVSSRTNSFS